MKFSQLRKGTRAERPLVIDGLTDERGEPIAVPMRALTGTEEVDVIRAATEMAQRKGFDKPGPGDQLFDMGIMVHTLALAVLVPDSTPRAPFFDGGAQQILDEFSREAILHMYEQQESWQDQCSPYVRNLTGEAFVAKVKEVAEGEGDRPFAALSPGTRWLFTRTMACLLWSSPEGKSLLGLPTPDSTPTEEIRTNEADEAS